MIKFIFLLLLCSSAFAEHEFQCVRLDGYASDSVNLYRCENDEVICYIQSYQSGWKCEFKHE